MTMGAFFALSIASAQGGYASFSVGYAGGGNSVIGSNYEELTEDKTEGFEFIQGTSKTSTVTGTYGKGLPISLAGGYMLNENFGLELGVTYFMGSEITSSESRWLDGSKQIVTSKGSQIRVLPQLVVSTGTAFGIELYAKTGLLLPVGGSTTYKSDYLKSNGKFLHVEGTNKGAFSLGYTGSFGASFAIGNLSIFGELQGVNLSIKGATRTTTKYNDEGEDKLAQLSVQSKETQYVEVLESGANTLDTEPLKALSTATSYNSIGLNVGVKINF